MNRLETDTKNIGLHIFTMYMFQINHSQDASLISDSVNSGQSFKFMRILQLFVSINLLSFQFAKWVGSTQITVAAVSAYVPVASSWAGLVWLVVP